MLTIFFTIIFIAELIIATCLIIIIRKINKKVCETNKKVLNLKLQLLEQLCKIELSINKVHLGLAYFNEFIQTKKDQCTNILSNNAIIGILFFFFNTSGKKILALFDLFIAFNKFLKLR